jgi:ribokinase
VTGRIVILGVFVADTAYRAARQPRMGETILGESFALGPGGKGSNQSVAAARAGGDVHFITRLGRDPFADMALKTWADAGVVPEITQHADSYTGAAYIFIESGSGNNAIIVAPGAAGTIVPADIDARRELIEGAAVFVTQLEQPMAAAKRGLEVAHAAGVKTILNPAPAAEIGPDILALCDFVTPNESEAEGITGARVASVEDAARAAAVFLERGVGAAVITLGEKGALYRDKNRMLHVPAYNAGPVVETTGAGDAFNGAFATALAAGTDPVEAVRFGCAAAGISVTRVGTAPSMPARGEILALLARGERN